MAHDNAMKDIQNPGSFKITSGLKMFFGISILIGIASFVLALKVDAHRAWPNFLIGFFFFTGLAVMGGLFTAIQHITNAYWSVTVRRIAESFMSFLPISLLLAVVLFMGRSHLYEWVHVNEGHGVAHHATSSVLTDTAVSGVDKETTEKNTTEKNTADKKADSTKTYHAEAHSADAAQAAEEAHIIGMKAPYLNSKFFGIRLFLFIGLWILLGFKMRKNSLDQDATGDHKYTLSNIKLSAAYIPIFGLTFTLFSIDVIMSLEPTWFSTIFGVYTFAGIMYSGFALMALLILYGKRQGVFSDAVINDNHIHDVGKFMLVFVIFWSYILFSQLMLQWYANLPEEIPYYIRRFHGGWWPLFVTLLIVHFILPFAILLPRDRKRSPKLLRGMAYFMLAGQWLDVYVMVMPVFYKEGPVFGWMEVGIFMGFLGLFGVSVGRFLEKVPAIPIKDPRLAQCLGHTQ